MNAHGWVKGFGFDLLVDTLRTLPTTHFIHIMSSNPRRNLPLGIFWEDEQDAKRPPVAPPLMFDLPAVEAGHQTFGGNNGGATGGNGTLLGNSDMSQGATPGRNMPNMPSQAPAAVEQRALHWVSFAQKCIETAALESGKKAKAKANFSSDKTTSCDENGEKVDNAAVDEGEEGVGDELAAACPYEIPLSEFKIDVLYSSVPSSQLGYALNGAIVGLSGGSSPSNGPGMPPPCLGVGLIRAIDGAAQKAYILTPLSLKELRRVERLEVGRLELPPALLQTARFQSPYLTLHSLSTAGTGAGAIKSRNNLMRSGQL